MLQGDVSVYEVLLLGWPSCHLVLLVLLVLRRWVGRAGVNEVDRVLQKVDGVASVTRWW